MSSYPQSLRHLLDLAQADPALSQHLASAATTSEWTRQLLVLAGNNIIDVDATDLSDLIVHESGPERMMLLDTELDTVTGGFLPPPTLDERYEKMKKDILDAGGTITYCDPVSRRIQFTPQAGDPVGSM